MISAVLLAQIPRANETGPHNELERSDTEEGYGEDEFTWATEQGSDGEGDGGGDSDGDSNDGLILEHEWEPRVEEREDDMAHNDAYQEDEHGAQYDEHVAHQDIQARAQGQHGCVVVAYPDPRAGRIINQANCRAANVEYGAHLSNAERDNVYHPFASKMDWEVARWAKLRGLSSTSLSDLLAIQGVSERLALSFKNANELNSMIDHELPTSRPKFKREQIVVAGESFDVYYRDVIECVRSLYSDPDFAQYLSFAPERHYTDESETVRLFHDMQTGKWWWDTQKKLDQRRPGGTIIPIILSSDKTQVTLFRNKSVYPVYLTIGNIPKEIRRKPSSGSYILLAYLPSTRLEHITNKASRRRTSANLYHACLSRILAPLKSVGLDGLHMASGNGDVRRCHLLFANFIGDYPEQLLATGIKFGECPKCDIDADETGSNTAPFHLRKLGEVLDALAAFAEGNLPFVRACAAAGIKPIVHPFWEDLPFANIFRAITPDVLHQLYQGLVKHLVGWLTAACGAAEIDARCRRLPPNHHIRLFSKGITGLSRISGTEHAQICRFLLGIVIGIRLPNNLNGNRLLRAAQGLLDFLYLAQYPCHSSETLQLLDDALDRFHDNKDIFVELGIRHSFNLPKLHATRHYHLMIIMFGTTDNYNTEYTERLHIDYAKDAYRATNHKDEFVQMTRWLERKEKILRHAKFVSWRLTGAQQLKPHHSIPPDMTFRRLQSMTKHPSAKAVSIQKLIDDYGATYFREALARYITQVSHTNDPNPPHGLALDVLAHDIHLPFRTLPVFHRIKWLSIDSRGHGNTTVTLDSVHARPRRSSGTHPLARRSDTALVSLGPDTDAVSAGIQGFRVGQVRAVFALPAKSIPLLFPPTVELSRSMDGGEKVASVVPLANIVRSVHLIPNFGAVVPREWTSDTVLDDCNSFWLNSVFR
ncbi:uncharacterized protein EDB93DRAFT_1320123 [Suillus bovinus]|uniref:uncharacterized protein n=1 Tax=Suillus bovinus TaxID=48563 RepID=UPI001B867CDC|nr:uncharacterized protein EDB93DRAFT_1320123 [Suillus bovinus]KAG2154472.1 hypothetical protein EDB93DRAFT_1320123 [Suillus bovinus]